MEEKVTYSNKLEEKVGNVHIADNVIAMIAEHAAMEVEGVVAISETVSNDFMQKVGMKQLIKSVKVTTEGDAVTLAINLSVKYGYTIPVVCQKVQAKVKSAVENMTALHVEQINIRIASVSLK